MARSDGTGPAASPGGRVPWRTIWGVIGAVVATLVGLVLVWRLRHVLGVLVVAVFLAIVFAAPVGRVERALHVRRGLAVFVVFVAGLALVGGGGYLVIRPVVDEVQHFRQDFPTYVNDAEAGRGRVGELAKQLHVDSWIRDNRDKVDKPLDINGDQAIGVAKTVGATVVEIVTIVVLAVLLLTEGPDLRDTVLGVLAPSTRARVEAVTADCAKAVTGYVTGNLLISLVAAVVTFIDLVVLGVPFAAPLAVWVFVADLIPLVGATLGAIPAVFVAVLHSTPAGVITLVVYVLYQQFENHVLQPQIMARTVALKPVVVLVSVLAGVELFGFLGALLAIPAAGVLQVIGRDVWDARRGRPKEPPTIGEDERPVDEPRAAV